MLKYNEQSKRNTVTLLYKIIQSTLTASMQSKDFNAFRATPGTYKEFDETTSSIIIDRLASKLMSKGK